MKAHVIFTTLIILNVIGILMSLNVNKYKVKFAFEIVENLAEIKFKSGDFGFKYLKQIAIKLHVFEANTTVLWRADQLSRAFREQFSSEISAAEPYHESEVPSRSPTPYRERNRSRNRRDLRKSQLYKSCAVYYDPDVEEAWRFGYTGKNVTVAVVDTGVYVDHPDLRMNVNIELSHSFVGFNSSAVKPDTLFSYKELNELTDHGTLAAGIIGSERGNQICSAGIAFNATLVGLKVFKLDDEDINMLQAFQHVSFSNEKIPSALEYKRDVIDIYSCSFNLRSAFVKNDIETKTILKEGVTKGRNGKGSIFVFSAGNAITGDIHDRNMEFYASSVYTITFSSVGKHGKRPSYTQPGSCILAATFGDFRIWAGEILKSTARENQCKKFQGTSAAAARGSGMIALMLEANPFLTWRDVQYIIILSSSLDSVNSQGYTAWNAAGRRYNQYFGFGLMNATAMVLTAKNWRSVSKQRTISARPHSFQKYASSRFSATIAITNVPLCTTPSCPEWVEQVQVFLNFTLAKGNLTDMDILLISPSNTSSYLLSHSEKNRDTHSTHQRVWHIEWSFTSVHFWGEPVNGTWILLIQNNISSTENDWEVQLRNASLTFYGVKQRELNRTEGCRLTGNISAVNDIELVLRESNVFELETVQSDKIEKNCKNEEKGVHSCVHSNFDISASVYCQTMLQTFTFLACIINYNCLYMLFQ